VDAIHPPHASCWPPCDDGRRSSLLRPAPNEMRFGGVGATRQTSGAMRSMQWHEAGRSQLAVTRSGAPSVQTRLPRTKVNDSASFESTSPDGDQAAAAALQLTHLHHFLRSHTCAHHQSQSIHPNLPRRLDRPSKIQANTSKATSESSIFPPTVVCISFCSIHLLSPLSLRSVRIHAP